MIADYGLRIADCGLRIADYGLRITDSLQILFCKSKLRINSIFLQNIFILGFHDQIDRL